MPKIRVLKYISLGYVGFLATSAVSSIAFVPQSIPRDGDGCYWTSTLIGHVSCNNTLADSLFAFFFNYWISVLFSPLFTIMSFAEIFDGVDMPYENTDYTSNVLWDVVLCLLMWLPIIFLAWYFFRGRHLTNKSIKDWA